MKNTINKYSITVILIGMILVNFSYAQSDISGGGGTGHAGASNTGYYVGWDANTTFDLDIKHLATGANAKNINFYTRATQKMTILGNNGSTDGFVGIGTTSPNYLLTQDGTTGNPSYHQFINGATTGTGTNDGFLVGIDGSGNGILNCRGGAPINFLTSGAKRMKIQGGGSLLIGDYSAATAYNQLVQYVGGNVNVYHGFVNGNTGVSNTSGNDGFKIGITYNSGSSKSDAEIISQQSGANMNFYTSNGSTTQRMQIAAGGNVGIGDAAQSSGKLYVKNDYSTSSADNAIQVSATNSSGNAVGVNITATGTASIGINNEVTGTGGSIGSFGTTYGMKIRNYAPQYNDNYGIYNILAPSGGSTSGGTGYYSTVTGTAGSTTEANIGIKVKTTDGFDVTGVWGEAYYGNGNNFGGSFKGFADDNTNQSIGAYGYANSSGTTGCPTVTGVMGEVYKTSTQTGNYVGLMGSANGYDGAGGVRLAAQINGSGTYSGTWTQSSDVKLKKDINPLTGSLALVLQISPKTYRYKTDIYKNVNLASGIHAGVIAQELEQILPGLIESSFAPAYHDPESGIDYDTVSFKSVNYIEIIPYLIGAIQEQQAQIQALQANPKPAQPASANQKEIKLSEKPSVILEQNNPNPFKENTTINYNIPEDTKQAQIFFYNSKGNVISTVEITEKGAGSLLVYGADLTSGVYTYTLLIDNRVVETKKMMKVK